MNLCFELALKAKGQTSPNPLVGCIITKNKKIIAQGFHKRSGHPHAELDAIESTDADLKDSTLYSNLEPCVHFDKKTPPCAQRIVKEKIKTVVISNLDPNPKVAGKGVEFLRSNGVEVIIDILKDEGLKVNEVFFYHIIHKKPFIHLKWAQTLDGFIATESGHSKWITNEESRAHVHQRRLEYDAIAIGKNTLTLDNPSLTCRLSETTCKKRLIFANHLSNFDYNVFNDSFEKKTFVVTQNKELNFKQKIVYQNTDDLLSSLYNEGLCSIYIEGGSQLLSTFFEYGFQKADIYIAAKFCGGGKMALKTPKLKHIPTSSSLSIDELRQFDNDVLITAYRN